MNTDNASRITVRGLTSSVVIVRDTFGIPHVEAALEADLWFGMGFACASDRLFQMDYDRRRACGRLSELLGASAVPADVLARRLGLEVSARQDIEAMTPATRSMFESYAAGVNAAIKEAPASAEQQLTGGAAMEPWEPWHSVAAFKVRHVLMGPWQHKLARATLLAALGPNAFSQLDDWPPLGSPVSIPPDGVLEALIDTGSRDLQEASEHLGFLSEVEGGSNVWAVHGSRTLHGAAVLCNDSHRALDVPNVYWQVHISCPEFSAIGATFPGLPGLPHFGHNGSVAWAITHAGADTQDLYIEIFDQADPGLYRTSEGWSRADYRTELIQVRDGPPVEVEIWTTGRGPVVHGDPRQGGALSLRWTGSEGAHRTFEVLRPMLCARDVQELLESQRGWVDPVNNFVAADSAGSIAYLTRGLLPLRESFDHRRLPAYGWFKDNEWRGFVPFEDLPRTVDPPAGFVMSANNVIIGSEAPYLSATFADPFRAERIRELLAGNETFDVDTLAGMQRDVVSWAALKWVEYLKDMAPLASADAERARVYLLGWSGELEVDSGPALLYGCFRRSLAEKLYKPILGAEIWNWVTSGSLAPTAVLVRRWMANDIWDLLGGPRPSGFSSRGRDERTNVVQQLVPEALEAAWRSASEMAGNDPTLWRWGDHHYTGASHPLSQITGDSSLDPPRVAMGGDSDTIQAASYGWRATEPFLVSGLSVYRQVVDLGNPEKATWVIPGGSSGNSRSRHYSDQLEQWATNRRIPMHWVDGDIEESAEQTQILEKE